MHDNWGVERKGRTHHEYTSCAGGKIFLPASCSRFKKRLSSRKLGLVTSSRSSLSQLSCRVPISKARRSRCSSVSPLTHFSLSHFTAAGGGGDEETPVLPAVVGFAVDGEEETGFGAPKNEVMLALTLGFLGSLVGRAAALRFRDMVRVRWRRWRDSLMVQGRDLRMKIWVWRLGRRDKFSASFKHDRVNWFKGTRCQRVRAKGVLLVRFTKAERSRVIQ